MNTWLTGLGRKPRQPESLDNTIPGNLFTRIAFACQIAASYLQFMNSYDL